MTPYQRIMRAADSGKGVRLSNEECIALAGDTAISTRAMWDDNPDLEDEERAMDSMRRMK